MAVSRNDAVKAGITVNGLPLMTEESKARNVVPEDLDTYYRDNVIGGPGSFYLVVHTLQDFSRSIRQKLILEISGLTPEHDVRA